MGLMVQPFHWTFATDNLSGTPPAALVGTNFTAGLNDADGTAVSVLSAISRDINYLIVGIAGLATNTADSNALLDVLVDPAGGTSWSVLIADLVCGFSPVPTAGTVGIHTWYHFPICVMSGASFGVQCRTAHTANITNGRVVMYGYGEPSRPDMWWCGQGVESLGIDAANSKGVAITPGNSGTFSTPWTTIGTSTRRYGAIQFGVNGSDATSAAQGQYWEVGYGSTKLIGSPEFYTSMATTESMARTGFGQLIPCNVPASTVWQCRATASGTAEGFNAALYGVY